MGLDNFKCILDSYEIEYGHIYKNISSFDVSLWFDEEVGLALKIEQRFSDLEPMVQLEYFSRESLKGEWRDKLSSFDPKRLQSLLGYLRTKRFRFRKAIPLFSNRHKLTFEDSSYNIVIEAK